MGFWDFLRRTRPVDAITPETAEAIFNRKLDEFATTLAQRLEAAAETQGAPQMYPVTGNGLANPAAANVKPTQAGRSSVPDGRTISTGGISIEPSLWSPETLTILEMLVMRNPDISNAAENVISLAATERKVYFADNVPEAQQKRMRTYLYENENRWYSNSSGIDALVSDMLLQLVTHGALSVEHVPAPDLRSIEKVVLVDAKNIRFVWNPKTGMFEPKQQPRNWMATAGYRTDTVAGLVDLNTQTYCYLAFRRVAESPYGLPPFLSALDAVEAQTQGMKNFRFMMRKLGMLGLMSVNIRRPDENDGEKQTAYELRCNKRIAEAAREVEQMMNTGVAVGWLKEVEFKLFSTSNEAQGAEKLSQIIDRFVMSGVKQDPAMLGRQFSTSETFGRVLLAKLSVQIGVYQKIVAAYLGRLYETALVLAGFKPGAVKVEFARPMVGDQVRDAQALQTTIDNVLKLRDQGIISQQQAANELGYEKPALAEAPAQQQPGTPAPVDDEDTDSPDNPSADATDDDPKTTEANARRRLKAGATVFDYTECGCCGHLNCTTDHSITERYTTWASPRVQRLLKAYLGKVSDAWAKEAVKAGKAVADSLNMLPPGTPAEDVESAGRLALLISVAKSWPDKVKELADSHVPKLYASFRSDKSVLSAAKQVAGYSFETPEVKLDLTDQRTIEFFKKHDRLYLGKFVTDPDTIRRFTELIRDLYIEGDTPIGSNDQAYKSFRAEIEDLLVGEDWKLRRIIDTSVNRLRNYAGINYMHQAEVEVYSIQGVSDSRQCEYCKNMQGKLFTVSKARARVEDIVTGSPEDVPATSPFLTSQFTPEQVKTMTGAQLEAAGVHTPPFHPLCRDQVVAEV